MYGLKGPLLTVCITTVKLTKERLLRVYFTQRMYILSNLQKDVYYVCTSLRKCSMCVFLPRNAIEYLSFFSVQDTCLLWEQLKTYLSLRHVARKHECSYIFVIIVPNHILSLFIS